MGKNKPVGVESTGARLIMLPAPDDLESHVMGLVHRDDEKGGGVHRVLPELRSSIQIMLADPYWVRSGEELAAWKQLPRIAFWGPKYDWCFGYARKRVKAYAVVLTSAGHEAIAGRSVPRMVDKICPLAHFSPQLERDLAPLAGEPFEEWSARSMDTLREFFRNVPAQHIDLTPSVEVLSTSGSGAVTRAAQAAGLSERQFRRVFRQAYGVAPKRYQRALKVDRLIRQLHPLPWEQDPLAEEPIPFADQPHLIREFRALTGSTPTEYVNRKKSGDLTLRSLPVDGIAPPDETEMHRIGQS